MNNHFVLSHIIHPVVERLNIIYPELPVYKMMSLLLGTYMVWENNQSEVYYKPFGVEANTVRKVAGKTSSDFYTAVKDFTMPYGSVAEQYQGNLYLSCTIAAVRYISTMRMLETPTTAVALAAMCNDVTGISGITDVMSEAMELVSDATGELIEERHVI